MLLKNILYLLPNEFIFPGSRCCRKFVAPNKFLCDKKNEFVFGYINASAIVITSTNSVKNANTLNSLRYENPSALNEISSLLLYNSFKTKKSVPKCTNGMNWNSSCGSKNGDNIASCEYVKIAATLELAVNS